ncbi:MAG: hypothetical protein VSS75_033925 [Candidatus Parabeggiatoa sp.]|nr:hypothetical protein [Candidatus Parabeggiatoa sp.]
MAKITLTQNNLLKQNEFKKILDDTEQRQSTVNDLLELLRELVTFEQEYHFASDVFYARFMRGEMGDALPFIKWAGRYELYLEAKQELESQIAKIPHAEKLLVSHV